MSQDAEDVKPKLNLVIAFDGASEVFSHFITILIVADKNYNN